jgi:hypothetical protein
MFVLTGLPAGTAADFEPDRRAPHAAPGGTRGLGADAPQGTEARYRRLRMGLPAHGASIDQLADLPDRLADRGGLGDDGDASPNARTQMHGCASPLRIAALRPIREKGMETN